jgi:hypothetical protein
MQPLLRSSLFLLLSGLFTRAAAGNFAAQIPADSFMYLEARNVPEYRQRLAEIPAIQKMGDVDWQKLILQLYRIGLENDDGVGIDAEDLSVEELGEILTSMSTRWQELRAHLNGDIAFSVGNFKNVMSIFKFNQRMRETLELAFDDMLDEEDLTPEEQSKLDERLAEEARLDAMEAAGILSQFKWWIDVKEDAALENKLVSWMTEWLSALNEDSDEKVGIFPTEWEGTQLYVLSVEGQEDLPSLNWAIKDGVWIITFSLEALKESLHQLANPPADSLANRQTYQDAVAYVGPSDFLFYGDLAPLNPILNDLMAEIPNNDPSGLAGQLPKAEAVLNWLALDAFLPYVIGSRLETTGVRTRGRWGFTRETAISRIMIDPAATPVSLPGFLHKDFDQFAAFNWQLGEGWSRFEKELMSLSPQAAAALGLGRMLASGQVGFDLKLQFMDHLDGQMFMVQSIDPSVLEEMLSASKADDPAAVLQVQMTHPTGGQNYLFAMGMKDEAGIKDAFNRLMTRFNPNGPPAPVLFEDQELFYPVPENFQGGKFSKLVSYCYLDGFFLLAIGDDQLLKDAVAASKNPEFQIIQQADFKTLLSQVSPQASSLEYTCGAQQKKAMQLLQSSLTMLQSENNDLEIPDLTVLAELIHQAIAVSVRKDLVFEIDGLMQFAPAE